MMFNRVPHVESEVITGKETVEDYLAMQKKLGRFYLKNFMEILRSQKRSGHFLEIGSGPGYQTARVAEDHDGAKILAVEPSSDMITIARSYIEGLGLGSRVQFTEGSVEDEGLIGGLGKFDLIYSTFSLHHWRDPVKAIHNLFRALKEDGILLIYDFERSWFTYHMPVGRKGIAESIRASYTPREIGAMIAKAGIKDFQVKRRIPYLYAIMKM